MSNHLITHRVLVDRSTTKSAWIEVDAPEGASDDELTNLALAVAGDRDFNDGSEAQPQYDVAHIERPRN